MFWSNIINQLRRIKPSLEELAQKMQREEERAVRKFSPRYYRRCIKEMKRQTKRGLDFSEVSVLVHYYGKYNGGWHYNNKIAEEVKKRLEREGCGKIRVRVFASEKDLGVKLHIFCDI